TSTRPSFRSRPPASSPNSACPPPRRRGPPPPPPPPPPPRTERAATAACAGCAPPRPRAHGRACSWDEPGPALVFDDPLDQQSSDDTDDGWGERPTGTDSAADLRRFLDEKPPHHI
ncbi:hypothetical protein, partial [Streptomyces galbus]|uniref:hypothetical protein n=1 Tax=Streptomyces galbus TaxID=33898 RepID=UPI0035E3D038